MDVVNIIKVLWGLFIIYLTVKAIKVIIAIREGKPMTAMVVDYAEEHDDDNISYYPIIESVSYTHLTLPTTEGV